jgi:hypothetical protein
VDARLDGLITNAAEFVDCLFGGMVKDVVFNGHANDVLSARLHRTRNEFRGNDFRQAVLAGTSFRGGVDVDEQFLPEGPGGVRLDRYAERRAWALAQLALVEDDKTREAALEWLRILSRGGFEEQLVAFFPVADRSTPKSEAYDQVLRVMATMPS